MVLLYNYVLSEMSCGMFVYTGGVPFVQLPGHKPVRKENINLFKDCKEILGLQATKKAISQLT